ncbi:hypothetical protein E2P81_ATG10477 [Venturia nashicola]|nr:hypothetical protein E2P81_ATG10477 [Venturia nashicola]
MNSNSTTTSIMADLRLDTQAASPIRHPTDGPGIATLEHKEKSRRPHDPVHEALNIAELLETILSYSSARDLTRSLTVSKQWHQIILGSVQLRRQLFLEPVRTNEYLHQVLLNKSLDRKDPRRYQRFISSERHGKCTSRDCKRTCRLIVEPHASLAPYHCGDISGRIILPSIDILKSAPAATLVTQPPLDGLAIECGGWAENIRPTEAWTFGAAIEAFEGLLKTSEEGRARKLELGEQSVWRAEHSMFVIWCLSSVSTELTEVKAARQALIEAQP